MDVSAASQNLISSKPSYVRNERTAGFIPVYNTPKAQENQDVTEALNSIQGRVDSSMGVQTDVDDDGFGFFDLLDMVNPLQHIPLVNIAYRAITGDEIKPISQIIGGGVFGGALGVAGGLVNAVIKEETGEDVAGNVISLVGLNRDIEKSTEEFNIEQVAYDDLPVTLLEFAQMPMPVQNNNTT